MDISVIFVSYNTKYFLEQAIQSVIAARADFDIEIIIVDNDSSDGTAEYIKKVIDYPLIIIQNESNVGFAAANNIGIRKANGKYILLLNPDTIIQDDTLEVCYAFAEGKESIGAIGVKMVDGNGNFLPESKRSLPTPSNALWKLSGMAKLFPTSKIFSAYNLGNVDKDSTSEVEVLCGAFMFIPNSVLKSVGGLDEDYFMYGEDIDLSFSITKIGYNIWYLGDHSIIHYKGQSTKKSSVDYVNTFYNAMSIFAKKHYSGSSALLIFLSIGIWFRKIGSLIRRYVGQLTYVILDAIIFSTGLFWIKDLWAKYQFDNIDYYNNSQITLNIFIYVIIWISLLYVLRSYKRYGNRGILILGALLGLLIILVTYSLLPNDYRTSRAIILLGALWVLVSGSVIRSIVKLFKQENVISKKRIGIVGSESSYRSANEIIQRSLGSSAIISLIEAKDMSPDKIKAEQSFNQLNEIVFCLKDVSLDKVLQIMTAQIDGLGYKIFGDKSLNIIGSSGSNQEGEIYGLDFQYRIRNEHSRYYKRLVDIFCGIMLLITSPLLYFKKGFRKNVNLKDLVSVSFGKKTLIGFNEKDPKLHLLPRLKTGLIPNNIAKDSEIIHQLNVAYALHYSPWRDVVLLLKAIL